MLDKHTINAIWEKERSVDPQKPFKQIARQDGTYDQLTYADMDRYVPQVRSALLEAGLRKGDRVALQAQNRAEYDIIAAAVETAGGIFVPIDANYSYQRALPLLEDAEPKFIFSEQSLYDTRLEDTPGVDTVFIISNDRFIDKRQNIETDKDIPAGTFAKLAAYPKAHEIEQEIAEDDIAEIQYTTGTTDRPDGAVHTHKSLTYNAVQALERVPFESHYHIFSPVPESHTFGSLVNRRAVPLAEATVVTTEATTPVLVRKTAQDNAYDYMVGNPKFFRNMVMGIERNMQKSAIRFLVNTLDKYAESQAHTLRKWILNKKMDGLPVLFSGSAKLPDDTIEALHAYGFTIVEGYGLSETGPATHCSPIDNYVMGSVGPPLKDVEHAIWEPNEEGIGEICVRGPNVMLRYWQDDAETQRKYDSNGWFYTGDLGYIDEDDNLFVHGRKKDVLVLDSGVNVMGRVVEMPFEGTEVVEDAKAFTERHGGKDFIAIQLYLNKGAVLEERPDLQQLYRHVEKNEASFQQREMLDNELTELVFTHLEQTDTWHALEKQEQPPKKLTYIRYEPFPKAGPDKIITDWTH